MKNITYLALFCLILLCVVVDSAKVSKKRTWDKMRISGSIKTHPDYYALKKFRRAEGRVCPDKSLECPSGYFCVENTMCLAGSVDDYSPIALITAGATARLIEDAINVKCLVDIKDSIINLVDAFESWENKNYGESMDYLRNGISDTITALRDCTDTGSIWSTIKKMIKKVAEIFFPEVVTAYEVLVNGVNVLEDFEGMMDNCSDGTADYVACGGDLGDIIFRVYKSLSKK